MISSPVKTPKILFVNPRFPRSLWGFQGMYDLLGVKAGQAQLGLATVAGRTPGPIPPERQDRGGRALTPPRAPPAPPPPPPPPPRRQRLLEPPVPPVEGARPGVPAPRQDGGGGRAVP